MLVAPTNRQFLGLTVRVFDPNTGKALEENEVIDLEAIDYDKKIHFLQVLAEGDLQEVSAKVNSKKDKE